MSDKPKSTWRLDLMGTAKQEARSKVEAEMRDSIEREYGRKTDDGLGLVYTVQYKGKQSMLLTEIRIATEFDSAKGESPSNEHAFWALWDTGAEASNVTQRVIDKCGLKYHGTDKASTTKGTDDVDVYRMSMRLWDGFWVPYIEGRKADELHDFDVLIGIDVISLGDFAVTHKVGETMLSFRVPSIDHIDFAQDHRGGIRAN